METVEKYHNKYVLEGETAAVLLFAGQSEDDEVRALSLFVTHCQVA